MCTLKCYIVECESGFYTYIKAASPPDIVQVYDEHDQPHTVREIRCCDEAELDRAWGER